MEDTFLKLKDFVILHSCVNDQEISRNTKIYEDLGIYGDDAVDFMLNYSTEFNVDIKNFMAADYFNSENEFLFSGLFSKLFKSNNHKTVLTVGHLEKGIFYGRLDEVIINTVSSETSAKEP